MCVVIARGRGQPLLGGLSFNSKLLTLTLLLP